MRATRCRRTDPSRGQLARVGGRTLAVDPSGHIAAVTGFTAPERLHLPPDLSPESTWLPTLGAVTVEPLPGGWLVRLGDDLFADPTRVVTVRAEMARLRRTLGSRLEAQPYRIASSVRATVLLPDDGPAMPGPAQRWWRRPSPDLG